MSNKALTIDSSIFFKRAKVLSKHLGNEKADAILIIIGNDTMSYSKTFSIHQWLFGYCLPNSAFILSANKLIILASKKVGDFLKPIIGAEKEMVVKVIERNKSDDDKGSIINFQKSIESMTDLKSIGQLPKDNFEGKFFEMVKSSVKLIKKDFIDVSSTLANIFAVKDVSELEKIKKASEVTAMIFNKSLKANILDAVDIGKKIKHSDLSLATEKYVEKAGNGDLEGLDVCYPPIVQSGGKYNLKFSVESDDSNMHMGVIVCSMGLRWDYYCSNVIRTLMFNPDAEQRALYDYVVDQLYVYGLEQMQPGRKFGDVSKAIEKKLQSDRPSLSKNLLTSFGFVTGLEFKDRFLSIGVGLGAETVLRKNMVIVFYVGVSSVDNASAGSDKRAKTYSIWIGDTVVVGGGTGGSENPEIEIGGNSILTGGCRRRSKYNLYQLKDGGDEDEAADDVVMPLAERGNYGRGQRRNNATGANKVDETVEAKRKQHQEDLYKRMLTECEKRLTGVTSHDSGHKKKKSHCAYKSCSSIPREDSIYNSHLFVDKRNRCVLLYPDGFITPLHMSVIKNVSHIEEADKSYLRINCNPPNAASGGSSEIGTDADTDCYLKELTIKTANIKISGSMSNNGTVLSNIFQTVKAEQRLFRVSEQQAAEKEDLVPQTGLVINARKEVPKIKDLYVRPAMGKSRLAGNLECHQNGLRFVSGRGENIDILFDNVKHAFFQPCEKEMIVLIHFNLKNPIMCNKKKQVDIQFYTEVGEMTTDLGKAATMHDRDDIESEQREIEMRRKINDLFKRFCDRVQEVSQDAIDFDQPFRKLGFSGCPFRSTVLLQPTTSCLVQLTEWPPFVVSMDEVELAFFERVSLSNKSFDLVLVYKNYAEKPVTITSLPQEKLEDVKSWLDSIDLFYSEGGKSLNWAKIMRNIAEDPQRFLEDGGWAPLVGESDNEEEEEDMDEDEAYEPAGSDGSEGSDDDSEGSGGGDDDDGSEYEEDEEDDDDEDGEGGLESDESRGMDWDELEEQARRDDRQKELNVQPPPPKKRRH